VKRDGLKIAVLIDSSTASSGEFTAIAFKSLPNVRFFGQASAGYTTSNQTFRLSDGACLYLATAYMADRKGNQYWPNIIPDTIIPHKVANNRDLTIDTAKAWLRSR
jgi:C-terminal processing protease CtpA/Prc